VCMYCDMADNAFVMQFNYVKYLVVVTFMLIWCVDFSHSILVV